MFLGFALLAACATSPGGPMPTRPRGAGVASGPIDLGAYRSQRPEAVSARFSSTIANRYGEGTALTAVAADLRSQQFACRAPRDRRGDPPAQMCRRSVREGECTHTWQVLLYSAPHGAALGRTRGIYDRACGDDGLLGGR